jgi:hypothetical protein
MARYQQLVRCYIIGNTLQAFDFQNAVIDLIISTVKSASLASSSTSVPYTGSNIALVYENTIPNDPLRRFVLDGTLDFDYEEVGMPDITAETKEYAEELIRYLMKLTKGDGAAQKLPWEKDPCTYHFHPDDSAGYSCSRPEPIVSPFCIYF